jgi:hypothetical protein
MARENQSLQVALIIFFMLAVVLAATTFFCGGKFLQAQDQARGEEQVATRERQALAAKEAECQELKRMIGMPDQSLAEIKAQFQKDMEKKANAEVKTVRDRIAALSDENRQLREKLRKFEQPTIDQPQGEITWADQRSRTVWLNLGRADGLKPGVRFGVYPPEARDLDKKKASVEVTRISGDHQSEARIVEDKTSDPITLGDTVYSRAFSPATPRQPPAE